MAGPISSTHSSSASTPGDNDVNSRAKRPRCRAGTKATATKAVSLMSHRGRSLGRGPTTRPTAAPAADQPLRRKRKSWAERVAESKGSKPCRECLREFSCEKALFGHMRWHREPWWEGVKKPYVRNKVQTALVLASPPTDDDHQRAKAAVACKKARTTKGKKNQGSQKLGDPITAASPSSAVRARGCLIDLNLPPPPEEMEDESPLPPFCPENWKMVVPGLPYGFV